MGRVEIKNITLISLPKKRYELSWLKENTPCSQFFTEASLFTFANNLKAYSELREFVRSKIRSGEY